MITTNTHAVQIDDLVLVRFTPEQRQRRRHLIFGKISIPEWSLPKQVKETKGNGEQVSDRNRFVYW